MKGEKSMAIQWGKKREREITSTDILDRFADGRILDTGEFYDRLILSRQLSLLLSLPQKRYQNRIR